MQRKAATDKQTPPRSKNSQKAMKNVDHYYTGMTDPDSMAMDYELVDDSLQNNDMQQLQKPKRPKRPTKSVNENLEPAFTNSSVVIEQTQYQTHHEFGLGGGLRAGGKDDNPLHSDSLS